jgi:hypothetical protein
MDQIPRHIKRALRHLADRAYEIELGRELTALRRQFERWQRGEVTAFDLSEAVHRFHQGPAHDLYVTYANRYPKAAVAHAIHTGILDRHRLPPTCLTNWPGHSACMRHRSPLGEA